MKFSEYEKNIEFLFSKNKVDFLENSYKAFVCYNNRTVKK